ncbi:MAG: superinfection immunity protein [Janthinobacterium lividum]
MSYQQPYGYLVQPVQTQVLVQPYRCSTAHVVIAWIVAVGTLGYLLPWAVAATRSRRNVASVALIDLLLGWSLVGWVVALVMACGSDQPVVVVHSSYGPPPQQPWGQAPPPQQPWQAPPRQQWTQASPPAPPALPAPPSYPSSPEATQVDPLSSEPTQQLPRSPWEPDHRR